MKYLNPFEKPVLSKAHLFGHDEYHTKFSTLEVPKGILLADGKQVNTYLVRIYRTTHLRPAPLSDKLIITICMELGRLGYALHGNINLYHLDDYKHIYLVNSNNHKKITLMYGQAFAVPNDQLLPVKNIITKVLNGKLGWGYEWSPVKDEQE